ncbi:DL-methionine transporter subunit; ATP-binding component of ABC superfamily [[Clostridium] ultunense Esp]|nr:DL-methionine transporter subunit; ATP-binding component of ABC superfamily [[Clostridium] ultunense Esp]
MIKIKELSKSYDNFKVLDNINISIKKGMIYGLIGRSGAGKSTLLRCINGLESYDSGSLIVDGIDIKSLTPKEMRVFRKDVGMIFQQFSLLNRLSVYDNIALPLKCWKYKNSYIDKKVKELLEMVGISDKIYSLPKELSGGQKQRVAIARALSMDPKILLCDEATSALDPKTAKSIIDLLCQINQQLGITIVVVTHQMSVVKRSCEEITILENGKAIINGAVNEVFLQQPQALINLIGEKDMSVPTDGITIKVLLSNENSNKPIITAMAREIGIDFIILGGEMDNYRNNVLGSIIINVDNQYFGKVKDFLSRNNVTWTYVYNSDSCPELEKEMNIIC